MTLFSDDIWKPYNEKQTHRLRPIPATRNPPGIGSGQESPFRLALGGAS